MRFAFLIFSFKSQRFFSEFLGYHGGKALDIFADRCFVVLIEAGDSLYIGNKLKDYIIGKLPAPGKGRDYCCRKPKLYGASDIKGSSL